VPFFFGYQFCALFLRAVFARCFLYADFFRVFKPLTFNYVQFDSCATG
jgi:hypothetical protein